MLPTSVRSGWGLVLVGRVCWRHPPVDSSSLSFEFLHFILRFWNQIFTFTGHREKLYINISIYNQYKSSRAENIFLLARYIHSVLGVYLGVFKAQFTGKFLPIWFTDVFLLLESSLQGLPLEVWEHSPPQHAPPGLPSGGQGPWKRSWDGNHRGGSWRDKTRDSGELIHRYTSRCSSSWDFRGTDVMNLRSPSVTQHPLNILPPQGVSSYITRSAVIYVNKTSVLLRFLNWVFNWKGHNLIPMPQCIHKHMRPSGRRLVVVIFNVCPHEIRFTVHRPEKLCILQTAGLKKNNSIKNMLPLSFARFQNQYTC